MAKKTKRPELTDEEARELARETHIKDACADLKTAKTAKDIRTIWEAHYLIIGHRVLGRLLLGQDAESATRRRRKDE